MISLDEDYLGTAADAIVVHGLKVCGGVLARLKDSRMIGAHFTNGTHASEILVACNYLMNFWAKENVSELYFVYNLPAWAKRNDKYSNAQVLIADLKAMFRYNGTMWVYDKNMIGNSVDLKITAGAGIYYRITPNPNPLDFRATTDVRRVTFPNKTVMAGRVVQLNNMVNPMVVDLDGVFRHKVQTDDSGWKAFSQGQMTYV